MLETTGVGTWEFDHGRDVMLRSLALNKVLNFGGDKAERKAWPTSCSGSSTTTGHRLKRRFISSWQLPDACEVGYRVCATGRAGFAGSVPAVGWLSDEAGRPLRSAGVAVDIDAQKTAEQDIRRNEHRLRMLMEDVPIPLCQLDDQQRFTYINRRFVETFGYQLADVPDATTWFEKAYPDAEYRAWVLDHWQQAVVAAQAREGIVEPDIYRVRCANGSLI